MARLPTFSHHGLIRGHGESIRDIRLQAGTSTQGARPVRTGNSSPARFVAACVRASRIYSDRNGVQERSGIPW